MWVHVLWKKCTNSYSIHDVRSISPYITGNHPSFCDHIPIFLMAKKKYIHCGHGTIAIKFIYGYLFAIIYICLQPSISVAMSKGNPPKRCKNTVVPEIQGKKKTPNDHQGQRILINTNEIILENPGNVWLVGGLVAMFFIFPIGFLLIPTDSYFFSAMIQNDSEWL